MLVASLISVYDGCNFLTDFPFTNQALVDAASQALLGHVFIDGPQGAFDSDPTLTFCCSEASCNVDIPYELPYPLSEEVTLKIE